MHTVKSDSEQGKRVKEVTEEVHQLAEEYIIDDIYPVIDVVSGISDALAEMIAYMCKFDDLQVYEVADQIKSIILDVNTKMQDTANFDKEPANDE